MTAKIIINPLKKEVEQLNSYSELLTLNAERIKKVMGTDADWLINTSSTPTPSPNDNQVYQSLQAEND